MKTRTDAARELVDYHVLVEDGIIAAFAYSRSGGDAGDDPVRLLEVSRATVPAGVIPVYFGPSKDIPYAVVIIELTEEEYRDLEAGSMELPAGWDDAEELHKLVA